MTVESQAKVLKQGPQALCPLPGGDLHGLLGWVVPRPPACLLSRPQQLQSANLAPPSPPAF